MDSESLFHTTEDFRDKIRLGFMRIEEYKKLMNKAQDEDQADRLKRKIIKQSLELEQLTLLTSWLEDSNMKKCYIKKFDVYWSNH